MVLSCSTSPRTILAKRGHIHRDRTATLQDGNPRQRGNPPPTPAWGSMVADGQGDLLAAWWISTFPGLAIVLTVVAFNLVGDGLRDALDPRLRT